MNIEIISSPGYKEAFYPLCETRRLPQLRLGILTMLQKWEHAIMIAGMQLTVSHLPTGVHTIVDNEFMLVSDLVVPTVAFIKKLNALGHNEALYKGSHFIAVKKRSYASLQDLQAVQTNDCILLQSTLDIIHNLAPFISQDFEWVTQQKVSQPLDQSNILVGNIKDLFIEEGAIILCSTLNTTNGPIYIGRNVLVMEGSHLQGPLCIGADSVVKMGACLYGGTSIGQQCVAGGEIKNSLLHDYSNKAHHGYLGDSIIGSWCNMGAGTSNSNVKNDAGDVFLDLPSARIAAGIKMGLVMGDYSRTAINTSINTGTVIGVSCNLFGEGLTPKSIPSFSWGYSPIIRYEFEKAIVAIKNWKKLKGEELQEDEIENLWRIFTSQFQT